VAVSVTPENGTPCSTMYQSPAEGLEKLHCSELSLESGRQSQTDSVGTLPNRT